MSPITELNITKNQIEKLSANLKMLLLERRVSENDIARSLGIPLMTVRRLVSGETTDPRISTLKLLADFFNVSIDYLISIDPIMGDRKNSMNNSAKTLPRFVPILNWKTLEELKSVKDIDLNMWKEWHPIVLGEDTPLSEHAFAFESRPSMQPRFPSGTLFIIDPSETPTDGDIILIKMKNDGTLSLRELIVDSPKWQLVPVVTGSESIFYEETAHNILGVVILSIFHTRKR